MAFPEERLWNADLIMGVSATPWQATGTLQKNARGVLLATDDPAAEGHTEVQPVVRGMPIRKEMLAKLGYSDMCRKCRMLRTGDESQPSLGHSESCRKRILALAAADDAFRAKVQAAERRTRRELKPSGDRSSPVEQEDSSATGTEAETHLPRVNGDEARIQNIDCQRGETNSKDYLNKTGSNTDIYTEGYVQLPFARKNSIEQEKPGKSEAVQKNGGFSHIQAKPYDQQHVAQAGRPSQADNDKKPEEVVAAAEEKEKDEKDEVAAEEEASRTGGQDEEKSAENR